MSSDIERAIAKARELEEKHKQNYFLEMQFKIHALNTHKLVWDVVEAAEQGLNRLGLKNLYGAYGEYSIPTELGSLNAALDALARAVNGGEG